MAEILNLRMARKRAARRDREAQAEANRAAHSVPARERRLAAAERERAASRLDGHLRRDSEPDR